MARVGIEVAADGRHAVTDGNGNVLGLHKSLASAQRQVQDYLTPQEGESLNGPRMPGAAQQNMAAQVEPQSTPMTGAPQQMPGVMPMAQQPFGVHPNAIAADHAVSHANDPEMQAALQGQAQPAMQQPATSQWGAPVQQALQQRQQAQVALVNRLAGPNGPPASAASQLQAYAAFHPQQQPAVAGRQAFGAPV